MEVPPDAERKLTTNTLDIPAHLLNTNYDADDEVWSWGLSPRVVQLPKRTSSSHSGVRKIESRQRASSQPALGIKVEEVPEELEPDLFLQVAKCRDVPEGEATRPRSPQVRLLEEPIRPLQTKPDETFVTDPGTFFSTKPCSGTAAPGEPRPVVVRRDITVPPSAAKPRTLATLNHNKTLVLRGDNDRKKPKLALVKELDNTTKPNFTARKPRAKAVISAAKKFKSVPYVIPQLTSKEARKILGIKADRGSKLEALQKRLRYDARKYAKCNIKRGSSSSDSSEEEEEEEEESSEAEGPPPKAHKEPLPAPRRMSVAARGTWQRGASNVILSARNIKALEDTLSERDRSIVADLSESGQGTASSTRPHTTDSQSEKSKSARLSSRELEQREGTDGESSDVSVTAEDLEMFDRWVEEESPSAKDIDSDRAVSVEIQNVLGIERKSMTPAKTLVTSGRSSDGVLTEEVSRTEDSEHEDAASAAGEIGGTATPCQEDAVVEDGVQSLAGFISQDSVAHIGSPTSWPDTILDRETLIREANYTEPTIEDVLNVTGKNLGISSKQTVDEEDTETPLPDQQSDPDITLLSTWAPASSDPAQTFSVHHFCTMAVQPQLPRVLHNITRSSHFSSLPVTLEDVRSTTELGWFDELVDKEKDGAEIREDTAKEDDEMLLEGSKVPHLSKDRHLYWTPAPPKMDLPPLFVKTHLFPQYESAIASAEQQALLNQQEAEDSSTTEEETESSETDEEDRKMRERIMNRRCNSAKTGQKKRSKFRVLGPDKIPDRALRLRRPGSAPVLAESEPHPRYASDYYSSYNAIEDYHRYMSVVKTTSQEKPKSSTTQASEKEKRTRLVSPYLKTPISSRGVMNLTPSYTKLLPIGRGQPTTSKRKVSKEELNEVKESLMNKRGLQRSTSNPCIHEEHELRKRAGSYNDLSAIKSDWDSRDAAVTALRKCYLPVFAHKLGSILSKDIVMLHQIIKKEQPELYSDVLNEVHRLTVEIQKGGDYLYYNKARRGALYVKLGMFKDARADLDCVVEARPGLADAYWHRHLIHVIQGDMNTALNDLTNIIRHCQNQPRVYLARAEIYQKQGDITGAILNYSQALKRDKDNAETYYKRAALFEEKGDILLALEDYTIANRLCPSNTIAILKKGKYNFERGAYSVAVSDFTAMLEQEPYNSIARTYRGRANAKMGKYTVALEDLSCAIHLDPGLYLPFYHRAVLLRAENSKRALQDFSVSILLNCTVENVNSFLHRGILYTELNRYEEAVPDFESVIELDWNNTEAHINLGLICMLHLKAYKRAIRCFTAAIEVDPTNDRSHVCRGDAYRIINNFEKALIDYTRAIHIRPDVARYYLYRGKLLLEMGQLDLASKHIRFASVLNTNSQGSGSFALQKAVVQSFLHNYDDAIFVLDRAAGLDPSPSQYILLGKTYLKAKRYSEAVDNFEKALMYLRRCRSTAIPISGSGEMDYKSDLYNLGKNPKVLRQEMPKSAAEVYFLIGKCHVESGNYTSALEALNSAIRIHPAYAEAYFQRGLVRIWVKSQRPLLDFNRALAYNPDYFQAYLTRAAYFGMRGRYSKAMFNCNEALRIQPNSVRAYLYRGALKYEIKNYELGVEDLSSAIKLDPLCSIAYYNRAVCYQHLKKQKRALNDYGIVLLLEKELNQRVLLNRGLLYYQSEDFNNALVDFKLAVKDSPDNALLYHTLGLCYHRNNELKKALESLTKAMSLKEHFTQAYISRGNVYVSLNSSEGYKKSKRDYCRALHYDPTNLTAHTNLGIALQSYGKMNEAWKQFTAAIHIDEKCCSALEARSIVNLQMGHLFGAFCDINTAVNLNPTSTMLTNRGVIQQYMKDPTNAMSDFQQAIAADPKYSLAYFNAANLYFNMRIFEKALRYYDLAVIHSKDDEGAVLNRAIAKVLLKDYEGALVDFDAAIKLNPFAAHSYFNRGNLHLTMGQNALAEEDYRKALSLQPNDSSSYSQLAVALGRQFKKVEALDNYKLAIKLNER